jgi:2'-5' RNA ligase
MRLFVALHLEPPFAATMAAFLASMVERDRERAVRWVMPQRMHLTLKFLGDVEPARVAALETGLDAALRDLHAPVLATADMGAFPNFDRPRIVWVGMREQGRALPALVDAVELATLALGWPRDTRKYQPHLTLGRVRDDRRHMPRQLVAALAGARPPARPAVPHPRVALMRSHLRPDGPHYEEVRLWRLAV